MSSQANTPDGSLTRRRFMKIGAAGTVGAVGLGGAGPNVPSATQDAEAFACAGVCIAAGVGIGLAAVGTGWMLRDQEILGSNPPPEGMTTGSLIEQIISDTRKRQSNNASTIVDNQNIVASGLQHTLYGDGKLAAIEALNAEESQSAVLSAAKEAANDYATVVKRNLLKSWNESVREVRNLLTALEDHPDADPWDGSVSVSNIIGPKGDYGSEVSTYVTGWEPASQTVTMPDGSEFTLETLKFMEDGATSSPYLWDPLRDQSATDGSRRSVMVVQNNSGEIQHTYMDYEDWSPIVSEIDSVISNVMTGLDTWVSGVYADVQAGELDTSDLLTAREKAAMTADQEDFPQAIADLMALNISVNLEREAEIHLPEPDATVSGQLGVTGDTTLSTGTVDPTADDMSYFLTYDISQGEGVWSDYNSGIDGGTVTFTSEPYEGVEYDIETNGGETVTVTPSDFADQGDGTWTADLSDALETDIAEINSVVFYSQTSETQFETVRLTDPFEIVTFTDTETGDEYDSADHSSSEPQDDTNYMTEEEWRAMEERQQKLIEKYEEAASGGGGGFLDGENGGIVGLVVIAALGGAAFFGR